MNWLRQWFCDHDLVSNESTHTRLQSKGGYTWTITEVVAIIFCKKCGYSKRIVY